MLLGSKLSIPKAPLQRSQGHIALDHVELLVNDWASVIVKLDVEGLSNDQARNLLLETRELLHLAADKALVVFLKHGWRHPAFRTMLELLSSLNPAGRKVTTGTEEARGTGRTAAPVITPVCVDIAKVTEGEAEQVSEL